MYWFYFLQKCVIIINSFFAAAVKGIPIHTMMVSNGIFDLVSTRILKNIGNGLINFY